MYSLYSEPEQTLNVDMIEEMEFLQSQSSSKLFDDLNSSWASLTIKQEEPSDYPPVIAAPRPSPLLCSDYPHSPYFPGSPLSSGTPSLCSTPSPTINPMDLMSDWSPCVKTESPQIPSLPLCEMPDDILTLRNMQIKYDDNLMDLDDDEAVLETLGRNCASDNEDDETFVPDDDEPLVKRQRLRRSTSPRSSPKPSRRSKLSSPYALMHYCPFSQCHFHSERHSDVDRHVKSVHEKIRFACPVCDKKLTRRDAVKRHQEAGDACNKALRKKAKLLAKLSY